MIIGLTGVYGSGKSTVAKFFKELGATIIDADEIGHKLLEKHKDKLTKTFGEDKKLPLSYEGVFCERE